MIKRRPVLVLVGKPPRWALQFGFSQGVRYQQEGADVQSTGQAEGTVERVQKIVIASGAKQSRSI